jgi:hypothetical protein
MGLSYGYRTHSHLTSTQPPRRTVDGTDYTRLIPSKVRPSRPLDGLDSLYLQVFTLAPRASCCKFPTPSPLPQEQGLSSPPTDPTLPHPRPKSESSRVSHSPSPSPQERVIFSPHQENPKLLFCYFLYFLSLI